jgi:hypothetical protein
MAQNTLSQFRHDQTRKKVKTKKIRKRPGEGRLFLFVMTALFNFEGILIVVRCWFSLGLFFSSFSKGSAADLHLCVLAHALSCDFGQKQDWSNWVRKGACLDVVSLFFFVFCFRDSLSSFARRVLWKLARIGERVSPYVGGACFLMGLVHLMQ